MPSSVLCTSTHECMNTHVNPQTKKLNTLWREYLSHRYCAISQDFPAEWSLEAFQETNPVRKYICFLRLLCSSSLVVDHSYSVVSTIELIHLPYCLWVCLVFLSTMSTLKLKGTCEHKNEIQSCYLYLGLQGSAVCFFFHCNIICKIVHKFHPRFYAISLL